MKYKILFVIFIILLGIPVLEFFHTGLPVTHDGIDHVARIANFYHNLQEGIIIPRWAANLNWGYGHPILEFLYPLPSYIASFFHAIGFSYIDGTKAVYIIGMFFSGICMYIWLSSFLDILPAIIGSLLYVYAPYRFVEVYVRGDIGENLGFVFMPLTLFFIYHMYKKQKGIYAALGGVSLGCLILSHNALSLMYLPFIVFYVCYLCMCIKRNDKDKRRFILYSLFFILIGFGLSAFFWIPGLLEGKFTLRNIVTRGEYVSRFVSFQQLLYGPWSYGISGAFTVQLGILQWIGLFLAPFVIWFQKKKGNTVLISSLIIYTLFAIFLMVPMSNFIWSKIILLQNFQFPWRFLAIPVFSLAVLGALVVNAIPKNRQLVFTGLILLFILFLNKDYWHAKQFLYRDDGFFNKIYNSTTDTGESSPIWSVRFMEQQPKAHIEVIDGSAFVQELHRSSTDHIYTVIAQQQTRLKENTLFFPGWEIFIDGIKSSVQFQEPKYRGIMTFFVPSGTHIIAVRYRETKLRMLADGISVVSIFIVLLLVIIAVTPTSRKSSRISS